MSSRLGHNLLKALILMAGSIVLAIVGLGLYIKLTSRPIGSPPPGFDDRIKYEWGPMSADAEADFWFGKHGKTYDTTHFRIPRDYWGNLPQYHGERVEINTVWPSFRSIHKEIKFREKNGLPPMKKRGNAFRLSLNEGTGVDSYSFLKHFSCSPVVRDEVRGVQSCNQPFEVPTRTRHTHYWPLDERIRTPYRQLPFHFQCQVTTQDNGKKPIEICSAEFAYNADVSIFVGLLPDEEFAIELVANFPKLLQFIQTLEVKP